LIADFNRRVVEARRQLQGGPPVVTPLRDAEAEVADWRARREERRERNRRLVAEEAAQAEVARAARGSLLRRLVPRRRGR
jgi:hypothetical protein